MCSVCLGFVCVPWLNPFAAWFRLGGGVSCLGSFDICGGFSVVGRGFVLVLPPPPFFFSLLHLGLGWVLVWVGLFGGFFVVNGCLGLVFLSVVVVVIKSVLV